jgi:phytoene dehydrogenase-like protein
MLSARDAGRWPAFATFVARSAGFLEAAYTVRAPRIQSTAAADLLALAALGRKLRGLGRREMMEVIRAVPMPVADLVEEWFEAPPLRAALAAVGVRDVQQGPFSGGTGLVFFHQHVGLPPGHVGIRRVARGGTGALPAALAAAARAHGVTIRTDAQVTTIQVEAGRVAGVVLASGEAIAAPRVVSSADPRRSFDLVDPMWLDPELLAAVDHVRMRGATARVHFALESLPDFASGGRAWPRQWLSGTVVVAPDLAGIERAGDAAKYGTLPDAPAMTAAVPTIADASLAPAGRHVMSVSVHHVPYALRGGWSAESREALGGVVQTRLADVAPGFADRVLARNVLTPADLESKFGATEGSLTQGEIALDQILFMRPVPACARYATPLPGFWLCGTGTHPASASGAAGLLAARELLATDGRRIARV